LFVLFISTAIPYVNFYIKITLLIYLQTPADQNFMRRSNCLEMHGKEKSKALTFISWLTVNGMQVSIAVNTKVCYLTCFWESSSKFVFTNPVFCDPLSSIGSCSCKWSLFEECPFYKKELYIWLLFHSYWMISMCVKCHHFLQW
jgi:hypothetical protein